MQLHTDAPVQPSAKALALALAALLAGCVSVKPARFDAWGGGQNCHFAHVTKGDFETALRRVFDASKPKVYGLRPEEGGALVERHWTLDVVFASANGGERWRLEYAPAGDGIDVRAGVENAPGAGLSRTGKEAHPAGNTANYQLLWSRIAYVLGKRPDWPRCRSASNLPRSALCSTGSSDSAPLRLAGSH